MINTFTRAPKESGWCSVDWCDSVGQHPAKRKAAGSIPGEGTCLGWGFGPWLGHIRGTTNWCYSHQCFSPSLSPSLTLSLKINKWNLKKKNRVLQTDHCLQEVVCVSWWGNSAFLVCSHLCEEQSFQWPDASDPYTLIALGTVGCGREGNFLTPYLQGQSRPAWFSGPGTHVTWVMEEAGKAFQTPLSRILKLLNG